MVFPDGQEFDVPERGVSSGLTMHSIHTNVVQDYSWDNLAECGVVASSKIGNQQRHWWGSPDGIARVKQEYRELGVK